jgi:mannose PTS system EIIA component
MVTGIIITHGNLCEELIATAKTIFGDFSNCHAVPNTSKSAQALIDELERIVGAGGDSEYIMFVDFFGGSCGYACLRFQKTHKGIPLISGVNLPILLAFLNKRDEVPFEKLADELILRGQDSIKVVKI